MLPAHREVAPERSKSIPARAAAPPVAIESVEQRRIDRPGSQLVASEGANDGREPLRREDIIIVAVGNEGSAGGSGPGVLRKTRFERPADGPPHRRDISTEASALTLSVNTTSHVSA
jgi:hypothetical protein